MEEAFLNRLQQIIDNVQTLNDTAKTLLTVSVLDTDKRSEAELTYQKLEFFIKRFNTELNNYFRLCTEPSPDVVSRFTTIQLLAEETQIELASKLKVNKNPETNNTRGVSSKLPKLSLPTFDGDVLKWQEFWDQFQSNIHNQQLPNIDKLLYLKSSLQGTAKKTIEGLESTNKNYEIAITTLRERYGKESQVIDAHYSALSKVSPADNTNQDCRRVFNELERHLRVLNSLGEDINHNHLRFLILEKFPEDLVYELKTKLKIDTIQEIRNELENIITAREEANRLVQERNPRQNNYTAETLHATNKHRRFKQEPYPSQSSHRQTLGRSHKYKFPNRNEGYGNFRTNGIGRFHNTMGRGANGNTGTKGPRTADNRRLFNNSKRKADDHKREPPKKKIKFTCLFCGEQHYNDECTKYKSLAERKERLKGRCFTCFLEGHQYRNCTSKKQCVHCRAIHNRALCPKKFPEERETSTSMHLNAKADIVLQTAVVRAMKVSDYSTSMKCRILLDSGSQRSYVTERVARTLKLDIEEESRLSVFTFGSDTPLEYDSNVVKIHLESRATSKGRTVYANVVPMISHYVPCPHAVLDSLRRNYDLADDGSRNDEIDILIGNDIYFSILSSKKIKLEENLYLIGSDFGWILSGQLSSTETIEPELKVVTYFQSNSMSKLVEPDLPLDKVNLKNLWDLESIGITDSPKVTKEEEAIRNFNDTTQFVNGRYSVCWPWKEYPPNLSSNFGLAYGRLVNLMKRLESTKAYEETLNYQLKNGIIEEVPDFHRATGTPVHYLPHHGVLSPGKPMRIVYDASAKGKNSKSLNECLYCGPSLIEDLTALLIRFRSHRIGLTADVEKAFLQISIQEKDRDVTRFLWLKDVSKPVTQDNVLCLRFCRVPFGIISSPFLLNATIKHHLSNCDLEQMRHLANDIYVDNLVTGADTVQEALDLHKTSRQIFKDISMNLRSWNSNSKEFLQQATDTCDDKVVKVLGLDWSVSEDTLKLRGKTLKQAKTKREVLRNIAQVFDPCGYAAPFLLTAKLFLQDLWKENTIKWDTKLSPELSSRWEEINSDLSAISDMSLQRHLPVVTKENGNQLHCFTDASTKAYAAVVYLVNNKGKGIIIGKSRLVPIKDIESLKIPRLELLGAVIGNRLLKYAEKALKVIINQQFLWTDSQIVIDWFNSEKLLTPFVARRISEIKENKRLIVRYVPTELNPADIGTRLNKTEVEKRYWLHGPDFLLQEPSSWPKGNLKELSLLAREGLSNTGNTTEDPKQGPSNLKGQTEKEPAEERTRNPKQMDENHHRIDEIKLLQQRHFPEEMNGKVTHLSRNLLLFIDVDGLLRSKGRLGNANWSYDTRYPILLPRDCKFTNDLIMKVHEKNYHVGANHTLSILREQYWIPQGKAQVQKILKRCLNCRKQDGGPYKLPPTPALPSERVNYSRTFAFTGLDYLGPVLVETEQGVQKRWICLYTCLAVRALHLEVVKDLTAQEALLALRRMCATRGYPVVITSDNAQQFKLTAEVLTQPFCIKNEIRWRFTPQLAPWFGGFYERLVALIKKCMKRTLDKNLLNDSQLLTVMKEIEAVLNSRPLTCVDTEMEHILKPCDFLAMGNCLTPNAESNDLSVQGTVTKKDLIQSWKRGLNILEEFKLMFVNRYLPSLRERYKHSPKEPRITSKLTPKVGQVVQIKGDGSNRLNWKVGKITELFEGKEGACRTAKVRVGNTEYTRSIAHLYPLEIDEDEGVVFENVEPRFAESSSEADMQKDLAVGNEMSNDVMIELRTNETNENDIGDSWELREDSDEQFSMEIGRTQETELNRDTVSNNEENIVDPVGVDVPTEERSRPQREAATRALEKIREWTQNLLSLL